MTVVVVISAEALSVAGSVFPTGVARTAVLCIKAVLIAASAPYTMTSEKIQAVDEVKHAVAVDGVVAHVGAGSGVDHAAHIALLVEDVVELQGDGGGILPQKTLGDLEVPEQFVGVHGGIAVTAAAVLRDVGGEAHVPRQIEVAAHAVGEGVGVQIGCRGGGTLGVVVAEGTVGGKFYYIGAEGAP